MSARFNEIESADYPLKSPKSLIGFFSRVLTEIESKIKGVGSSQELVIAHWLLEYYAQFLQFFDGANTERTPCALVKTIEFLINTISPKATMLPSPIHEYNYSTIEIGQLILTAAQKFVPDAVKDFPFQGIHCISFPHVERDNILMHAVLGHEIGHPIADEFLNEEETKTKFTQKQQEIAQSIQQLVDKEGDVPLIAFKKKQARLKYVLTIRRRALEEIISDCVSVHTYGPSALFAMYGLLSNNLDSLPEPNQFYPPYRMRLRYIFNVMKALGYIDAIMKLDGKGAVGQCVESTQEFITHIDSIVSDNSDKIEIEKVELCKIAFEWVELSMGDVIKFLDNRLKDIRYKTELIPEQIPELLNRFELGIPPNEIGVSSDLKQVDWRSSVVAGWIYNIGSISIPFNPTFPVNNQHFEIINRLTMKAIEDIFLTNEYQKVMTQTG